MSTSRPPARLTAAVTSDQALVAEAIGTALSSRGIDPLYLRWPGSVAVQPRRRRAAQTAQVGILVSELDRWVRIRAARLLLERVTTSWVVLTQAPRGPAWGAVLEAGALLVLPGTTSLDDLSDRLRHVALTGEGMSLDERTELIQSWADLSAERAELSARIQLLTPREREVLRLLYAGDSVARIAEVLEVSPATVRSQVKSVLRKLDVNTQLGAVAAFGYVLELEAAELSEAL